MSRSHSIIGFGINCSRDPTNCSRPAVQAWTLFVLPHFIYDGRLSLKQHRVEATPGRGVWRQRRTPPPLSDRCLNTERPMMATSGLEKCNSSKEGLVGRAKVINGGVGGGNPPLACLMLSYVTVTEQGFCVSWASHIRAYARDLGLSIKETLILGSGTGNVLCVGVFFILCCSDEAKQSISCVRNSP